MNTKLTLSIEQKIIRKAKEYAKERNRSLSDIVEDYLKMLTEEEKTKSVRNGSIVESLKGSFKIPADVDYKKELQKELAKKHL